MRSFEELRTLAEGEDGAGVWSILLSSNPSLSAEFANRYQEVFNSVVDRTWHLTVGALHANKTNFSGDTIKYAEDEKFHGEAVSFRNSLLSQGRDLPELSIVFFDPRRSDQNAPVVILPLDAQKISHHDLYKSGFQVAHTAVLRTFGSLGTSPYNAIPIERSSEFFEELERQLKLARLKSFLVLAGRFVVTSLLAGIIAYPVAG
ncbi:MAG TPA: hypothetical protein PLL33_05555 [Paracoccus sp. (in: a-proteobacteria)]|nr:hypothetical protein [Paracoccus sp. (in: a-proteobacteria)]